MATHFNILAWRTPWSSLLHGFFSPGVASRGDSLVAVCGLFIARVSSCLTAGALGREGFSSCRTWVQELPHVGSGVTTHGFRSCRTWVQELQLLGSSTGSIVVTHGCAALRRIGFSQVRDTCVSCIGRQILYH